MASKMWGVKLAMLVLGLLVLVPESTQLNVDHPLFSVVQRINIESGPFLGLVISSGRDEKFLKNSTYFTPHQSVPSLTISGRKYSIGKFNDVPAIYVIAGEPLANVGVTVQILIDTFRISGIINYGASATVSNKIFITDVLVPTQVAYTGSWTWQAHVSATVQILVDHFHILGIIDLGNAAVVSPSVKLADVAVLDKTSFISAWTWKEYEGGIETSNELPSLRFGDYNVPEAGDNKLGSLQFLKIKKYTPKGSNKETFWYYTDPEWLEMASQLKDINLERCTEERLCTKDVPSVVYRVKGASSDAYVLNHAYGKFLNKHLNVSTVDRKSAAVVSTAVANGVKHIVFRGASNKPGMPYDKKLSALATKNSFKVASKFVELLANQLPLIKYKY